MSTQNKTMMTPNEILNHLMDGKCKALRASVREKGNPKLHTITLTAKGPYVLINDSGYSNSDQMFVVKGTMTPKYNTEDKDHRRILLHRIWRWSNKTVWKEVV